MTLGEDNIFLKSIEETLKIKGKIGKLVCLKI